MFLLFSSYKSTPFLFHLDSRGNQAALHPLVQRKGRRRNLAAEGVGKLTQFIHTKCSIPPLLVFFAKNTDFINCYMSLPTRTATLLTWQITLYVWSEEHQGSTLFLETKLRGHIKILCSGKEGRGWGVDKNRGHKTPREGNKGDEGNCSQLLLNDTFANNHPSEVQCRNE